MINKRNFLKILSTAVVSSVFLGNYSTVWMGEQPIKSFSEIKADFQGIQHSVSVDNCTAEIIHDIIHNTEICKHLYSKSVRKIFEDIVNKISIKKPYISTEDLYMIADEVCEMLSDFVEHYDNIITKFSIDCES